MPKPILKSPQSQNASLSALSATQARQNRTSASLKTDPAQIRMILRKRRSPKYLDAIKKLDTAGRTSNKQLADEEDNSSVTLRKGDIILTPSASKGEKKFHQYWRVESDNKVYATVYDGLVLRPGEENEMPMYAFPLIPIYDLKGKEIWQALDSQIQTGMRNLESYCQAANLSLNNEASSEQWASIPVDSPLLKKK